MERYRRLTSINVLPTPTYVVHKEPVLISMLPTNSLVGQDMLVIVSLAPTSTIVSKLMLAALMLPVTRLLDPMSANVTLDTAVMDRPVLMEMNVSVVTTLVTPPSPHVPILMVHTDERVTKDTKETVWSVKTSMNAPTDPCRADANCTNNLGSLVCTRIQMRHMNVIASRLSREVQRELAMTLTNVKKKGTTVMSIFKGFKLK